MSDTTKKMIETAVSAMKEIRSSQKLNSKDLIQSTAQYMMVFNSLGASTAYSAAVEAYKKIEGAS